MEEIEQPLLNIEDPARFREAFEQGLPTRLDLQRTLPTSEHIPQLVMEMERYLSMLNSKVIRHQALTEAEKKHAWLLRRHLIPLYQYVLHGAVQDVLCEVRSRELDPLDAKDQGKQLRDAMRRLKALDRLVNEMLPCRYSPPDEQ